MSNAHYIVADIFLSEIASSFLILVQVLILLWSEMAESAQYFDHLIFRNSWILFGDQHVDSIQAGKVKFVITLSEHYVLYSLIFK